jgi:hypothetical protein
MIASLPLLKTAIHILTSLATLILLLPTQDGVVLCADRREWNRLETQDSSDKIFKVSAQAAFATSGAEAISIPIHGKLKKVYSLSDSVRNFYAGHPFRNDESEWDQLLSFLKAKFEEAHRDFYTAIEVSPGSTDDVVWEIDLVYLSNGKPASMQLLYRLGGKTERNPLDFKPYIAGETEVTLRILRGPQYPGYPDARFSDLYALREIARVWAFSAPEYPRNVTVHDALIFSHTFIRATAERTHLLKAGPELVGPTCDCALMKNHSGFLWLQRDSDTRTSGLSLPR